MFIKEQMSNEKVLKESFDEAWSTIVLCWTKQCTLQLKPM
jgi:hypothetical protein